jgi:hypothetical protein
MKNVIASYNSYKDKIYEGDPILVDQAFFNGIYFDSDNLTADVLFMIFSTDIKAVTIRFPIEFKNVFEFNKYKKEYGGSIGDYTLTMFRKNNRIPSVTVLSCFYKNREAITNENTFNLYASHSIGNTIVETLEYKVKNDEYCDLSFEFENGKLESFEQY